MSAPTLSVIMPNYNHARYLRESLGALVGQRYRPLEIIVMDDGSTDDSVAIIEKLANEHGHVRLHRHGTNQGVVQTMADLIAMSSGDYLYSAAADDRVLPGFLEKSMGLLERHPYAALCATLTVEIDERGRINGLVPLASPTRAPGYISPEQCLKRLTSHGHWIAGSSVIYRKDLLLEEGGFLPELGPFSDGLVTQALMMRHGACFIPEPLACWRVLNSGYLNATREDVDELNRSLEHCVSRMRTVWQPLFPPSYVERFERRHRLAAGRFHLTRSEEERPLVFEKLLGRIGALDSLILKRRRGPLSVFHALLAQAWLAGRLGVSPLWLLRRVGSKLARAADLRVAAKKNGWTLDEPLP